MVRTATPALMLCALAWLAVPAPAQRPPGEDAYLQRQRQLDREIREQLERELPADQKFNLEWGGWYNSWVFLFDDGINSSRTLRRNDFRLWGGATLDRGTHEFYARMRMSFIDFNAGDSYDGNEDDIEGPNLERGWYRFDLRNAMQAYSDQTVENDFAIKIGRDLAEFGTGYALSLPLDQILLEAEIDDFKFSGLIAKTIRSTDDIDRSFPDAGRMQRNIWGIEARYRGFDKHEPFVYVFWNDNQKSPKRVVRGQNFDYDSVYVGLGSLGELAKNWRYSTEWVWECGRTFNDQEQEDRSPVNAWGFDALVEHLSQGKTKPRFVVEYMFASGDPDRIYSPTNTVGGNTRGLDRSFVAFGYRDTGLTVAPRLSNLHIWRAGGSFLPLEDNETFKDLELGTDWFLYWKNRANGAISDPTADVQAGYVGWEMDYFANWRFTSDLALTLRYGVFFPGNAFSDQTTRTFFLTGVTWSF